MAGLIQKIRDFLFFAGISQEDLDAALKETGKEARQMTEKLSGVFAVLFAAFSLFCVVGMRKFLPSVVSLIVFAVDVSMPHSIKALPDHYDLDGRKLFFQFAGVNAAGFVLLEGFLIPNGRVAFSAALPLIFGLIVVAAPWQHLLLSAIDTAALLLLSALTKSADIFLLDAAVALGFFFLSICMVPLIMQGKLAEFAEQRRIEVERDADALTGLYHKNVVREIVTETLLLSAMHDSALMFIDVDNFKHFNDTYGHQAGDRILVFIANCVKSSCGANATVGRFGGDEFIAFIPEIEDAIHAAAIAQSIIAAIGDDKASKEATELPECPTVSIGVAICPSGGNTYTELMQSADRALYKVKGAGKNTYRIYHEGESGRLSSLRGSGKKNG